MDSIWSDASWGPQNLKELSSMGSQSPIVNQFLLIPGFFSNFLRLWGQVPK